MTERNAHRSEMSWLSMDATEMAFEDGTFEVVIDKCVLDTFNCMVHDRTALTKRYSADNATRVIAAYFKEVIRVLRPGGVFLCISFGAPPSRLGFFELPHCDWNPRVVEIASPQLSRKVHYAYICTTCENPASADHIKKIYETVQRSLEPSTCTGVKNKTRSNHMASADVSYSGSCNQIS